MLLETFNVQSLLLDRDEQSDNDGDGDPDLVNFRDIDENITLWQPFAQAQLRLTEKFTLNAGLHTQYSSLNKQFVLEPRAAVNYTIFPNHSINLGYGLHHQSLSTRPAKFTFPNSSGEQGDIETV